MQEHRLDVRGVGAVELVDADFNFAGGTFSIQFLDQLHDLLDGLAGSIEQQGIGSGDRSNADPAQLGVGALAGDGLAHRFGHRLGHRLAQLYGLDD